jgi:hypothetical protein
MSTTLITWSRGRGASIPNRIGHGACLLNNPVERCRHPFVDGMTQAPLDIFDHLACAALVPNPVEFLCDGTKLNDEVFRDSP